MPQPEKHSKTAWVFSQMLDTTSSTEKIEILPLRKEKNIMLCYLCLWLQLFKISWYLIVSVFNFHNSFIFQNKEGKTQGYPDFNRRVKTKFPHINYEGLSPDVTEVSVELSSQTLSLPRLYTWSTEWKINNWRIYLSQALRRSDSEDLMEEK